MSSETACKAAKQLALVTKFISEFLETNPDNLDVLDSPFRFAKQQLDLLQALSRSNETSQSKEGEAFMFENEFPNLILEKTEQISNQPEKHSNAKDMSTPSPDGASQSEHINKELDQAIDSMMANAANNPSKHPYYLIYPNIQRDYIKIKSHFINKIRDQLCLIYGINPQPTNCYNTALDNFASDSDINNPYRLIHGKISDKEAHIPAELYFVIYLSRQGTEYYRDKNSLIALYKQITQYMEFLYKNYKSIFVKLSTVPQYSIFYLIGELIRIVDETYFIYPCSKTFPSWWKKNYSSEKLLESIKANGDFPEANPEKKTLGLANIFDNHFSKFYLYPGIYQKDPQQSGRVQVIVAPCFKFEANQ